MGRTEDAVVTPHGEHHRQHPPQRPQIRRRTHRHINIGQRPRRHVLHIGQRGVEQHPRQRVHVTVGSRPLGKHCRTRVGERGAVSTGLDDCRDTPRIRLQRPLLGQHRIKTRAGPGGSLEPGHAQHPYPMQKNALRPIRLARQIQGQLRRTVEPRPRKLRVQVMNQGRRRRRGMQPPNARPAERRHHLDHDRMAPGLQSSPRRPWQRYVQSLTDQRRSQPVEHVDPGRMIVSAHHRQPIGRGPRRNQVGRGHRLLALPQPPGHRLHEVPGRALRTGLPQLLVVPR